MFYTYKNCRITLNGQDLLANNVSFNVNTQNQPLYYANKKYGQYGYVPVDAVGGILNISYSLTGNDPIKRLIYNDTGIISGNFGGLAFQSGYLTSYVLRAEPNKTAEVEAQINFFDHLTGDFSPITGQAPLGEEILNCSNIDINGTGLGDYQSITDVSFHYSNDVAALYSIETATGLTNLKPDRIVFGKRVLETALTFSNLSGDLSLYGKESNLELQFTQEGKTEVLEKYFAWGKIVSKGISSSVPSITKTQLQITQHHPSEAATISSFSPSSGSRGEIISVVGTNFLSSPDVFIGDYELEDFTVVSDTLIQFAIPDVPIPSAQIKLVNNDSRTATSSTNLGVNSPVTEITLITPHTGFIGDFITVKGTLSLVDEIRFSPTGSAKTDFIMIDTGTYRVRVPYSGQWGPLSAHSSYTDQTVLSTYPHYFVPKPEIHTIDNFNPYPGDIIYVSGLALSGITGAFFGGTNLLTASQQGLTGIILSGSVTDVRVLPIQVPTGAIYPYLTLVGQSGLSDSIYGISPALKITGVFPTSGKAGDSVILSGQNFITGALSRASDDAGSSYFNHWLVDFNGITTGFGLSGSAGNTLTGKVPENAEVKLNTIKLRNPINGLHPSGISFDVTQGAPSISDVTPSSGIGDGRPEGPTSHIITGNNLSGVTGIYFIPSGSGFNLSSATNFLNPRTITFTTESNQSLSFSLPTGLSGTYFSGYLSPVLQSRFGTGISPNSIFAKFPPTISGVNLGAAFVGETIIVTGRGFFPDTTNLYFSGLGSAQLGRKIFASISGIQGDPKTESQVLTGTVPGLSNSTRFKIVIENGAGTAVSDASFGFLGSPEIRSIFPESGHHGDTIVISGAGFKNISKIFHGTVPITSFQTLDNSSATGLSFVIPNALAYQAYDPFYKNIKNYIDVQTAGGFSTSTGKFLTIPDNIVCSGFYPSVAQRGTRIIISGANIILTTGVEFSGVVAGTRTVQPVTNDGFISKFFSTGSAVPKTGLSILIPSNAADGQVVLKGLYSQCQTADSLTVLGLTAFDTISPGSGIIGETIEIHGSDLHASQYFFKGYSSGTIRSSSPLTSDGTDLNKSPTPVFLSPLATTYVTGQDGEKYVQLKLPNVVEDPAQIYFARRDLVSPLPQEISFLGTGVVPIAMISGLSTGRCNVGDTIYISGLNVWNTLENAVMISGTGIKAPHDTQLRRLEFLSQYNTKLGESISLEDGRVIPGRNWYGLGDHWIPNDPKDLYNSSDLNSNFGSKFNEQIRQHIFRSGVNTPTNTDTTPKSGVWKIPITVGNNFIGTGFLIIPIAEPSLIAAHRRLVEAGPTSAQIPGNEAMGTFRGRAFTQYDLDGDSVIDPFMWSGQTTGTDFQYSGVSSYVPSGGAAATSFYSAWLDSETLKRFNDIAFLKYPLIVEPEIISITGFSPVSGIIGSSALVKGVGLGNVKKGYFYTGSPASAGGTELSLSLGTVSTGQVTFITPNVSFPSDVGFVSGIVRLESDFSSDNSSDLSPTDRRYYTITRPPTITGFEPIWGIEGETTFAIFGVNLQYVDSLTMVSQMDGDIIQSNQLTWGQTISGGKATITGLSPTGINVLPQDYNFCVAASSLGGGGNCMGTFTLLKGDLTVHGNLFVEKNTYLRKDLFVSGEVKISGDLSLQTGSLRASGGIFVEEGIRNSGYIISTGYFRNIGSVNISDDLTVSGSLNISGDINIKGNINLGDATSDKITTHGDLFVNDDSFFNDRVVISGALTVEGETQLKNNVFISGDLSAANDILIGDSLTVSGHSYLKTGVSIEGDTIAKGNIYEEKSILIGQDLIVSGTSSLIGNVYTKNNLIAEKELIVSGLTTFQSGIVVREPAIFNKDIFIEDDVFIGDSLTVSGYLYLRTGVSVIGDTVLKGDLYEENDLLIGQNLTVSGTSNLIGNVYAKNDLIVERELIVSGLTNLKAGLVVAGDGIFNDNLLVENNLSVAGTLTASGQTNFLTGVSLYGPVIFENNLILKGELLNSGATRIGGGGGVGLFKEILNSSLVLHLSAEIEDSYSGVGSSWKDLSSKKNNAVLSGSPTFEDGLLEFNGINQYAVIPTSESLHPPTFTVGAVFRPMELGGSVADPIFQAPNFVSPVLASYQFSFDSNRRIFSQISFTDSTSSTLFTDPVPTGEEHFVSSTWDGTGHRLYLSGQLISTEIVGSKNISYSNVNLNILTNVSRTKFLKAEVRDLHLYDRALFQHEIDDNYRRLTKTIFAQRELMVSGGKVTFYSRDNPSKFGVYEGNKVKLSGIGAGIFVNGLEIGQGSDYHFENISFNDQTSGVWNFNVNQPEKDTNFNFLPNTGLVNAFGSTLSTGGYHEGTNNLKNAFPLEFAEDTINRIFVSLDGISLVPGEDFNLIGLSGIALKSAPKAGEEILIRQITPTIGSNPLVANLFFPQLISGISFKDLSTGTQLHFVGGVEDILIEDYNIYDSNVSVTGGNLSVYNQWTGIDVNISNIGNASAVNISNEPGASVSVTSTNANVIVANEGTINYIDNSDGVAYIYANTGVGKVFISGGFNLLTGNIYITGGINTITGQVDPISIYNSVNYITGVFNQKAGISGSTNYIYTTGSGAIGYISGTVVNFYNSVVSNFDHDNSTIIFSSGAIGTITGTNSSFNINQTGGYGYYSFSGGTGYVSATGEVTIQMVRSGTLNVTGETLTINDSTIQTLHASNLATYSSTNFVTGGILSNVEINQGVSSFTIHTGNISLTGTSGSAISLTINTGKAYVTGISPNIYYSSGASITGRDITVYYSTGGFFSGSNISISGGTSLITGRVDNLNITGGINTLLTGTANVTGNLYVIEGGIVSSVVAGNVYMTGGTGIITAGGSVYASGSIISVSGNESHVTGQTINIIGGTNYLTGSSLTFHTGQNYITLFGGQDLYVTGGINTLNITGGIQTFNGGSYGVFSQVINPSLALVTGNVISITGGPNYITGANIEISGNSINTITGSGIYITKGLTTVQYSSNVNVYGEVETIMDNQIGVLNLTGGSPRIYKGVSNIYSGIDIDIDGEGGELTVNLFNNTVAQITGSIISIENNANTFVTGLNIVAIATGVSGKNYITGNNIYVTGTNYITGIAYVTGNISESTVTINSGTSNIYEGTTTLHNSTANIYSDTAVITLESGILNITDAVDSLTLNAKGGTTYISGTTTNISASDGVVLSVTGAQSIINSTNSFVSNSTITSLSGNSVVITGGANFLTGNLINIYSGTNSVNLTGGVLLVTGGTTSVYANVSSSGSFNVAGAVTYVTGYSGANISINAAIFTGASGSINYISGTAVAIANGTNNITGGVINITGGTNHVTGTNVLITGASLLISNSVLHQVTGAIISISGGINNVTGETIFITGGSGFIITGSSVNITGENVSINNSVIQTVTGNSISIISGTSNVTGEFFYISGGQNIITGANITVSGGISHNYFDIVGSNVTNFITGEANYFSSTGSLTFVSGTNNTFLSGITYITGDFISGAITGGVTYISDFLSGEFLVDGESHITVSGSGVVNVQAGANVYLSMEDAQAIDFSGLSSIEINSGITNITGVNLSGFTINSGIVNITGRFDDTVPITYSTVHIHNTGVFTIDYSNSAAVVNASGGTIIGSLVTVEGALNYVSGVSVTVNGATTITAGSNVVSGGNTTILSGSSTVNSTSVAITGGYQNVAATNVYISGSNLIGVSGNDIFVNLVTGVITGVSGIFYVSGDSVTINNDGIVNVSGDTVISGGTIYITGQPSGNTFSIQESVVIIEDVSGVVNINGGETTITATGGEINVSNSTNSTINYVVQNATIDGPLYITGGSNHTFSGTTIHVYSGEHSFSGNTIIVTGGTSTITSTSGLINVISGSGTTVNVSSYSGNSGQTIINLSGNISALTSDQANLTGEINIETIVNSFVNITGNISGSRFQVSGGEIHLNIPSNVTLEKGFINASGDTTVFDILNSGILNLSNISSTGVFATIINGTNIFNRLTGTVSISDGTVSIKDSSGVSFLVTSGTINHQISGDVGVLNGTGNFFIANSGTLVLTMETGTISGGVNTLSGSGNYVTINNGTNYISGIDPTTFSFYSGSNYVTVNANDLFITGGSNIITVSQGHSYITGVGLISGGTNYITGDILQSISGTLIQSFFSNSDIVVSGATNVWVSGNSVSVLSGTNIVSGNYVFLTGDFVQVISGVNSITGLNIGVSGNYNYITGPNIYVTGSAYITGSGHNISITGTGISLNYPSNTNIVGTGIVLNNAGTTYITPFQLNDIYNNISTTFYVATGLATGYRISGAPQTGEQNYIVSVGGIIQNPFTDYSLNFINGVGYIDLVSAPVSGEEIEIRKLGVSAQNTPITIVSASNVVLSGNNVTVEVQEATNVTAQATNGTFYITGVNNTVFNNEKAFITGAEIIVYNEVGGTSIISGWKQDRVYISGNGTTQFLGPATGFITGNNISIVSGRNHFSGSPTVYVTGGINSFTGMALPVFGGTAILNQNISVTGGINTLTTSNSLRITGDNVYITGLYVTGTSSITGNNLYLQGGSYGFSRIDSVLVTSGILNISGGLTGVYISGGTTNITFISGGSGIGITGGQTFLNFASGAENNKIWVTGNAQITGGIVYVTGQNISIASGTTFITGTGMSAIGISGGTNYISGSLLTDLFITGGTNYFTGLIQNSNVNFTGGATTIFGASGFTIAGGSNVLYAQNVEGNVSITGSGTQVVSGTNYITGIGVSITGGVSYVTGVNINIYSGVNTLVAEDDTLHINNGYNIITLGDLGVALIKESINYVSGGTNEISTEVVNITGGINSITGSGNNAFYIIEGTNTISVSGDLSVTGGTTVINNAGNLTLTPENVISNSGTNIFSGGTISSVVITGGQNSFNDIAKVEITGGINSITGDHTSVTGQTLFITSSAIASLTGNSIVITGGTTTITEITFTNSSQSIAIYSGTTSITTTGDTLITGGINTVVNNGTLTLEVDDIFIQGGTNNVTGYSINSIFISGGSNQIVSGNAFITGETVVISGCNVSGVSGRSVFITGGTINVPSGVTIVSTGSHISSNSGLIIVSGNYNLINSGINSVTGQSISVISGTNTIHSNNVLITGSANSVYFTGYTGNVTLGTNSDVRIVATGNGTTLINVTGYSIPYLEAISGNVNVSAVSNATINSGIVTVNTGETFNLIYSTNTIQSANNLNIVGDLNTVNDTVINNFTGNYNTVNNSTLNIFGTGYIDKNSTNTIRSGSIFISGGVNTIIGSTGTNVLLPSGTSTFYISGGTGTLISGMSGTFYLTGGRIENINAGGFTGTYTTISSMIVSPGADLYLLSGSQAIINSGNIYITGQNAYVSGGITNITGENISILSGLQVNISGINTFSITGGTNYLTGEFAYITGANTLTANIGTAYVTGESTTVSNSTAYISGVVANISAGSNFITGIVSTINNGTNWITGTNFLITGGTSFLSGQTVSILSGEVRITGGFNFVTGNSPLITGGTNYVTGVEKIVSGNTYVTGNISYGSFFLTGGSSIIELKNSNNIVAVTGNPQIISGIVSATGDAFYITGGVVYATGTGIFITGGTNTVSGVNVSLYSGTNTINNPILVELVSGINTINNNGSLIISSEAVSVSQGTNIISGNAVFVTGGTNYITGSGNFFLSSGLNTYITGGQFFITGATSVNITGGVHNITGIGSASITGGVSYVTGQTFYVTSGTNYLTGITAHITGGALTVVNTNTSVVTGQQIFVSGNTNYITGIVQGITGGTNFITGKDFSINITGGTNIITGQTSYLLSGTTYLTGITANITGGVTYMTGGINSITGVVHSISGGTNYVTGGSSFFISGGINSITGNLVYVTGGEQVSIIANSNFITGGNNSVFNSQVFITGTVLGISGGTGYITGEKFYITGGSHYITGGTAYVTGTDININSNVSHVTGQSIHFSGGINYVTGLVNGITGGTTYASGLEFNISGGTQYITGTTFYITSGLKINISGGGATISITGNAAITGGTMYITGENIGVSGGTSYITGSTFYITGGTDSRITGNTIWVTGGTQYITGTYISVTGQGINIIGAAQTNNVTGEKIQIISGTNRITGNFIEITGGTITNIDVTGELHISGVNFLTLSFNDQNATAFVNTVDAKVISGISYISGSVINTTGGNVYLTGGNNHVITSTSGHNILSGTNTTAYISGGTTQIYTGVSYVTGSNIQINTGTNYVTGENVHITGNYLFITGQTVSITSKPTLNGATVPYGSIYNDSRIAQTFNYITGTNFFVTGTGNDVISITNIPGGTTSVTGNPKIISGTNHITGEFIYITGGTNTLTGHIVSISGSQGTSIVVHGSSGETMSITGYNVGPVNITGNATINASTVIISSGLNSTINGETIFITGGVNSLNAATINLTSGTSNINGGTNYISGSAFITGGDNFVTGTDTRILSGINYITGTDIKITGGTIFLTGTTESTVFNLTGSHMTVTAATGTNFSIYSGVVDITGSNFFLSGNFEVRSGSFNRIESIGQNLILNAASTATMVNPNIYGQALNFGVLQINGDVSFLQTSGDTTVSGVFAYRPTGMIPTSSLDTVGSTGDLAFDNNYMYYKTTSAGWKRVAMSTW